MKRFAIALLAILIWWFFFRVNASPGAKKLHEVYVQLHEAYSNEEFGHLVPISVGSSEGLEPIWQSNASDFTRHARSVFKDDQLTVAPTWSTSEHQYSALHLLEQSHGSGFGLGCVPGDQNTVADSPILLQEGKAALAGVYTSHSVSLVTWIYDSGHNRWLVDQNTMIMIF